LAEEGRMLRVVEASSARSSGAPVARFSLGGAEFLIVALESARSKTDAVLGTFTVAGRDFAVLGRGELGPDLLDLLTPRELEIACLVAAGFECKQIARRLRISFHTVRVHLGRIYAKLGLHKQTELAARIAARFG
jgi:DNA-binding NarL/FixJ family response regulator